MPCPAGRAAPEGATRVAAARNAFSGTALARQPQIDLAASRTMVVTDFGREIMGTCDDLTSVTRAPACSAMKRWLGGGIALSSVVARYHDRTDFHAGARLRLKQYDAADRGG